MHTYMGVTKKSCKQGILTEQYLCVYMIKIMAIICYIGDDFAV